MALTDFGPANFCVFGLKNTHIVTEMGGRWKAASEWGNWDTMGLLFIMAATTLLKLFKWREL